MVDTSMRSAISLYS